MTPRLLPCRVPVGGVKPKPNPEENPMSFHKTGTLAERLRALADELESAERYGLPLPDMVSVSAHKYGQASFHTDDSVLFDAWADYTEAEVVEYDHASHHWSRATADVNGLPLQFATAAAHPGVGRVGRTGGAAMSSTHQEYVGDGYSVWIQHCEADGCDAYLGVNYPSDFCDTHSAVTR